MWEMAVTSIGLFLRGKLFANPAKVFRQIAIGVLVTAAVLALLAVAGVPLWLAALVAGFGGGMLQPYLFKDLRYR
jgi:Na+-transporting NADH:ubiquinone oxidoreductase subunit NqrB